MKKKINLFMILFLLVGLVGVSPHSAKAEATPCMVTDTGSGAAAAGTLNYWLAAVGADSSTPACSTITFNGDMTVLGPIQINHDVTIDGETYNVVITGDTDRDGVGDQSLVTILASTPNVTLKNLTLTAGAGRDGPVLNYAILTLDHVKVLDNLLMSGAIRNFGTLNVVDSYFSTSKSEYLNSIINAGTLSVTRTTFSGNASAIDNNSYNGTYFPTATITDSTFANNTGGRAGAVIANHNQGMLTVSGSTFSGNSISFSQDPSFPVGVIWNEADGSLVVTNSTFSGNTTDLNPDSDFGVIAIKNHGSMTLTNNTFANNQTLGAYTLVTDHRLDPNGTVKLFNNIFVEVADPTACAYNLYYPFFATESSNNLFTGYCGRTDIPTPDGFTLKTAAEISLGTLGNYGGPTQTIPLITGSAAIDAGDDTKCPATDQRGKTRPLGTHCDAGAYEYGISIGPDTLPNATYATPYSQQITVTGGNGPYTFSRAAPYLPNFSISSSGVLSGTPIWGEKAGSYSVTVNVTDSSGATASRDYTLVIDKVAPTVKAYFYEYNPPPYYYGQTFVVYATVLDALNSYHSGGTVTFSVDGNPISDCVGITPSDFQAQCHITQALSVGERTITANYTPGGDAADYYLPASGFITTEILAGSYEIYGIVFDDANQNGTQDLYEGQLVGQTVSVSTCDGATLIATGITDRYGQFALSPVPGGECVRFSFTPQKGWSQTTTLPDYILSRTNYIKPYIGVYNKDGVDITFSPQYRLPGAGVGHAYSQAIAASGGTAPYSFTIIDGALPGGLALSADGRISGAPTTQGTFPFIVKATDALGYTGFQGYELDAQQWIDGIYTLTSALNPSTLGKPVTFTFTGTSESYDPSGQRILPFGLVTFQADGEAIPGCERAVLNYNWTGGFGNYPATCTTSALALAAGEHAITASFTPSMNTFGPATLSLTQEVHTSFTWTTPIFEGGSSTFTAALPADAVILGWGRSAEPGGTTCEPLNLGATSPVEIIFGDNGIYQVCLDWRIGSDVSTSQQAVTVENVAPAAIDGSASVWPEPSMVGTAVEAVAAFFDHDRLASCMVDYGDGTVLAGEIPVDENACVGLGHAYAAAGTYTVTFTAIDPDGASGEATTSHTVIPAMMADLDLTKTDSKDPVKPGASLVYTLAVKNLGLNAAQSVVLSDKLDPNTTYVSVSAPKGWSCGYAAKSATVTCASASLASGGSAVIKITVTVSKTAKVGKELVNTAQVSSATNDPNLANNTVTHKTMVTK